MESLGDCMDVFLQGIVSGGDDLSRRAARSAEVNAKWKNAVVGVYGEAAGLVLSHTNAVYILAMDVEVRGVRESVRVSSKRGTGTQLVVYADDSMVRSDLDAKQEFLKLRFREQGEPVEVMHIIAARFDMKERHPFQESGTAERLPDTFLPKSCTDEGFSQLLNKAEDIEDIQVKNSLKKAISADFQRVCE